MTRKLISITALALLAACSHRPLGEPPALSAPPSPGTVLRFQEREGFSGRSVALVDLTVQRLDESATELRVDVEGEPLSGLRTGQIQRYSRDWKVLEDAVYFRPLRYEQGLPLISGAPDGGRDWYRSAVTRPPVSRPEQWTVLTRWAGWESVSVPAGTFRAARYERFISFFNDDPFRWRTERRDVLWYAPEIGFWVKREVSGKYSRPPYQRGRGYELLREDTIVWELQAIRPPS